jgi:hypothetical protein
MDSRRIDVSLAELLSQLDREGRLMESVGECYDTLNNAIRRYHILRGAEAIVKLEQQRLDYIGQLYQSGHWIRAIKSLRTQTGASLMAAKEWLEAHYPRHKKG